MRQNSELVDILHAGSFLIDPTRSTLPSDLQGLLVSRLAQYHAALGRDKPITPSSNIAELQLETAQEALSVVERVQKILCMGDPPVSSTLEDRVQGKATIAPLDEAPAIGTRDLAQLRTLLSIVFKWGVEPLLILVMSAWPSKPSPVLLGPKIIDLTTTPEDYRRLSSLLLHLLTLLFPSGVHGFLPQTLITTTLLNRHLTDLLKPCMALGWLPKSLSSEATPTVDEIRPNIMRLLEMYVLLKSLLYLFGACAHHQPKFATVTNHISLRCCLVGDTHACHSYTKIMCFSLESSTTSSRRRSWSLCCCIWRWRRL